jgi:multisubunit Na+/H+ antiporter MnhF subunit
VWCLRLALRVLKDIVLSNIDVARRVLGPESALQPAWVWVPIRLQSPAGIVALAGVVTLTPGTVSSEVTEDRRYLLVHALHCTDPAALVADIQARYEAPASGDPGMKLLPVLLPWILLVLAVAMALAGWRLLRGPTLPDRILALDALYMDALALLVVLSLWLGSSVHFELMLLIGLLGFIGTVALGKMLMRGDLVE